jgi:uncharacterized membrane protein (UPF0127 family)
VESDGKILVNLTRANVVCEHIEIAARARHRMRGLLGRESLEPGDGMLLQPAPSIHTAFMHFAIDVVFMDGTLRVTKIIPELRPWRVAAAHRSWGVVELAAGEAGSRGIVVGDQLGVVEVTDDVGAFAVGNGGIVGLIDAVAGRTIDIDPGNGSSGVEVGDESEAGVRVLLVGADRRFRSVAAVLLTRRGCAVTLGDRTTNVAELAQREQAEVVVLDAGVSLTEAAHAAALVESLDPPVGVVIVGEEPEQGLSAMPVLPKWGSFDGLYNAIAGARPIHAARSLNGGGD